MTNAATLTLVGGPTVLIEVAGFRLLTDPTFDMPGEYRLPHVTLRKTTPPALGENDIGSVDAVLLSHDQHADNLDTAGRAFVHGAPRVFTTIAGAARLGGNTEGLAPWAETTLTKSGRRLVVTATPARHGPAGIEPLAGDVIGFVLQCDGEDGIYVTGDTVWFDGTAEVARRFSPRLVVLFAGAARSRGPFHLTMDVNDALETAHAFPSATIVPVHCEGWAHFSESQGDLEKTFEALGVRSRLRTLERGVSADIGLS
jgi:L-ascorbate metabolism protein UlaG (beta-lactamase superfamily)